MKRIALAVLALLICLSSFAQQALGRGSRIVSPQINEDNSVTFRLVAPKAVRVHVTGDFLPAEGVDPKEVPTFAEMTEKNGVWEYTTKPLASELYSYSFIVDGLKILDPSNVYINRDVASTMNIFIVGGGCGDYYKVNDVPHGTVSKVW
jgi:enterochelin esterase family protein